MTADSSAAANRTPTDDSFQKSMGDFARRLGERMSAKPAAADLRAAAERRQAALRAYDRERLRRRLMLASAVTASVAVVTVGVVLLAQDDPRVPVAEATAPVVEAPIVQASAPAAANPAAPRMTEGSTRVALAPADRPASAAPASSLTVASAELPPVVSDGELRRAPAPSAPEPLGRGEVREVQKRLSWFGFNPGPLDGNAGPRTQAAAFQYRHKRGLAPASDAVDQALLDALRQDPAPVVQVAQRAGAPRRAYRSSNPFDEIARWFQSIGR